MVALVVIFTILSILNSSVSPTLAQDNAKISSYELAPDPLNATYFIEGTIVRLQDGRSEMDITLHSATKIKTDVYANPVYDDLNGDGHKDAALLLIYEPGGSGIFFYVVAALNINGMFQGTNAVLLGDRITPHDLQIRNGVLLAKYADRRPGEPMIAPPSVPSSKYLILKDAQLETIAPLEEDEKVLEGWVTIGHEVRSFQPCLQKKELWLEGDSPALREIMVAYAQVQPNPKLYLALLMVLAGKFGMAPTHGLGAAYEATFLATKLVRVIPGGTCSIKDLVSDSPVLSKGVDFPTRIQQKITFDVTNLDQDGLYGAVNGKRALAYEFCIPDIERYRSQVKHINSTLQCMFESPGRIGCGNHEYLCIGSTQQKNFREVLRELANLPYVTRIHQSFFE